MVKMVSRKWLIVPALALALLVGVSAVTAQNVGGSLPVNSITVNGFGQASGSPDVAYVTLGVDVLDANVGSAVNQANQDTAAIIAALTDAGIAAEDIQTTGFNVYPDIRYDPQTNLPTGETSYRVQNTLQVTVRDINQVSGVIEAGLNAGADTVYGLNFGIQDAADLEQQARVKAVEDARTRAARLAEAMGVTVGDPIIITEGTGGGIVQPLFAGRGGADVAASAPPINPGQLNVSVTIQVTFAIGG